MLNKVRQRKITLGLFAVVSLSLAVFFIPFLLEVKFNGDFFKSLFNNQDGFFDSISRSYYVAAYQSLLILLISTIIAFSLVKIPLYSFKSRLLSFLIIPILIGNVSTAFIWKIILKDNSFFFESYSNTFMGMFMIQFWQYGTLFTYLIWLNLKSIEKEKLEYSYVSKLSPFERIRDVYIPKSVNLSILLFIIGFIFCLYEDAKIFFIFKASRGTNTELINQWFNRTYQSNSLINPDYAFQGIASTGFLILISTVILLIVLVSLYHFSLNWIVRLKYVPKTSKNWNNTIANLLLIIIVVFAVAPVLLTWLKQKTILSANISQLGTPLLLAFIAAIFATSLAILFGIFCRLLFRKMLDSFNRRSATFLIMLFVLVLTPSICTLLLGFKWMRIIGYNSQLSTYVVWIVGHSILCLPLLGGFSVVTHFRIKNSHLDYLESQNASYWEKIKDIFIYPFKADYILTFIIAFSLIWNESVINKVLSDIIPSFITELNKTILGKSADYSKGMSYLFISIALGLTFVLIWNRTLKKRRDEIN